MTEPSIWFALIVMGVGMIVSLVGWHGAVEDKLMEKRKHAVTRAYLEACQERNADLKKQLKGRNGEQGRTT